MSASGSAQRKYPSKVRRSRSTVAVPEENWSPLRSWHCALMRSGAGFFAGMRLHLFPFDLGDLVHAALVPSAGEGRGEELVYDRHRLGFIEEARADGEDV